MYLMPREREQETSMDLYIEITAVAVGLLYLWLEYRASVYLWPVSVVMPAIYLYVYYNAGIYGNFWINIYYFLIALYGMWQWKYGGKATASGKDAIAITHLSLKGWLSALGVYAVAQTLILWGLTAYTDSTTAVLDSLTTALSIVGMWLLARKNIEHWWVWFVADIAGCALYIQGKLYPTAVLYALYAVVAIFGYLNWKRLMQHESGQP